MYYNCIYIRNFFSSRSSSVPSLFVSEHTQVTLNPKDDDILLMISDFKKEIGKGVEFKKFVAKARSSLGKLLSDFSASTPTLRTVSFFVTNRVYIHNHGFFVYFRDQLPKPIDVRLQVHSNPVDSFLHPLRISS